MLVSGLLRLDEHGCCIPVEGNSVVRNPAVVDIHRTVIAGGRRRPMHNNRLQTLSLGSCLANTFLDKKTVVVVLTASEYQRSRRRVCV